MDRIGTQIQSTDGTSQALPVRCFTMMYFPYRSLSGRQHLATIPEGVGIMMPFFRATWLIIQGSSLGVKWMGTVWSFKVFIISIPCTESIIPLWCVLKSDSSSTSSRIGAITSSHRYWCFQILKTREALVPWTSVLCFPGCPAVLLPWQLLFPFLKIHQELPQWWATQERFLQHGFYNISQGILPDCLDSCDLGWMM